MIYNFKFPSHTKLIEIGGGYGELTTQLLSQGFSVTEFVEPDQNKFINAYQKLKGKVDCYQAYIDDSQIVNAFEAGDKVIIIMQDVIEHIPFKNIQQFFIRMREKGVQYTLIGRTPNLTSPYGLRNSFGDNTHIHRFNNISLGDYLCSLGFTSCQIKAEPYKITGMVSLLRFIPYSIVTSVTALAFWAIYGQLVGPVSPNIVFYAE